MTPWLVGGGALALVASLAWGFYERGEAIAATAEADKQRALAKHWQSAAQAQARETGTANVFVDEAAKACAAEVKAIERGRTAAKEVRDAKPDDAVRVLADGLCRDYPTEPACRARQAEP